MPFAIITTTRYKLKSNRLLILVTSVNCLLTEIVKIEMLKLLKLKSNYINHKRNTENVYYKYTGIL